MRTVSPTETIECPLCCGVGELTRAEVLDRLGVRDFARVAQLSAEEAFRLLQNRHDREHQNAWSRFETELAKRVAEIREQHKDALRSAQSDRDDLIRRVENGLREVAQLRERNQKLEGELSKAALVESWRRSVSKKRHGLGLALPSAKSCRRTATSYWRIAMPVALRWSLAWSWTTRTKRL